MRRANSSAQPLPFSPDSSSPALPALRSVGSNGGDTPATRRSTREQLVPSVALANGAPSTRRAPQRETGSSPHIRRRIPAHAMLVRASVREEGHGGGSSGFWRRGRGAIHAPTIFATVIWKGLARSADGVLEFYRTLGRSLSLALAATCVQLFPNERPHRLGIRVTTQRRYTVGRSRL